MRHQTDSMAAGKAGTSAGLQSEECPKYETLSTNVGGELF